MSDAREVERRECPRCKSVQNFAWRTNRQTSRSMGVLETKSLNCQTCGWAAAVTDPVHVDA